MLVKDILSEDVVYVSVPGTREKALEIIVKKNVSVVPVVKEGSKKLVGILTRSDLITNPDEEQVAMLMTRDLVTAELDEPIEEVAKKMVKNNVRRVPVVEGEDLAGIVTAFDIVSLALTEMDIKDPVENYMIKTVPTAWDQTPLNVAFENMALFGLKSLIGLNNEGKMSGILTETDFIAESEVRSETTQHDSTVGTEGDKWSWDSTSVLYIEKNKLKFTDKVVRDVASDKVTTANSKTKVSACAEKMKSLNVEQLPVIGIEGDLIGLVRASDLIKALI
ncbi:MAG: CBS domain-containing protein [Methanobacteriaceae archaeon]|jgi:CBS domain-containing protein|uniref:CBS domain-containing protein n=1 Tax=unclassified Methanobrevibacter TaxID=2638681 RepID=UPI002A1427D1|nr:CBS domain-containing protein [Methanobacteriaceae archaeon]MDD3408299.1 CBS domain-containing protein [Methanobacteriaceae archaeon]MDD4594613.1 CBS domain-containing protein [Methanobacteriaceae archaeon]